MKLQILFIGCFFWLFCFTSFSQTSQTLHNAYTTNNKITKLVLEVGNSPVEIRKTQGSRVLVEMTIKANLPNERMLAYLVDGGRYDLITNSDEATNTLTLSKKKNNNALIVKGQECKEEMVFIVYVPAHIQFVEATTASIDSNSHDSLSSSHK